MTMNSCGHMTCLTQSVVRKKDEIEIHTKCQLLENVIKNLLILTMDGWKIAKMKRFEKMSGSKDGPSKF